MSDINLEFDDRTLAQHVENHASIRGELPAMVFGNLKISYRDYDAMASRLANALADHGVNAGDVIGIHLPNIPLYAVTLVAASKLGCIATSISPLLSPSEIDFQIRDANIKVVLTLDLFAGIYAAMDNPPAALSTVLLCSITDPTGMGDVALPDSQAVTLMSYSAFVDGCPGVFQAKDVHWNDTFMLQYTGGTTGKPKGAQLSVRNVMHNALQYSAAAPWTVGEEVVASAFPFFHVGGLSIVFYSALCGGMMLLIPDPRNTEYFCQQMQANPPTVMGAVPALYDMLLQDPLFKQLDFSRLRIAYTAAAPLTSSTFSALNQELGDGKISDLFGMTETSPCFVTNPPQCYKVGSVGLPVPGTEVKIVSLDDAKTEMPVGEAGEICASGPQVMKGYLNLPQETANALQEMDGKVWMCTGDVGYLDEDGYLFLCDRAKDMLIVGGYKVFSVEVEDKLQSMPEIAMSAVIGKKDPKRPGNEIVTLYVQLDPAFMDADHEEIKQSIKDYCSSNMAAYKVPKEINIIDEIPLTPVGKIDKKSLRK
ncbi:long-chain fatty acid--CoA ligase [Maricurvus nonylphenolicus]|uniref:class I adenylate-forming enzyme family protein n=1 Tax=Maricurvus nonylphenolicus TaxID=1008307 RepID=UPI0036F1F60C